MNFASVEAFFEEIWDIPKKMKKSPNKEVNSQRIVKTRKVQQKVTNYYGGKRTSIRTRYDEIFG